MRLPQSAIGLVLAMIASGGCTPSPPPRQSNVVPLPYQVPVPQFGTSVSIHGADIAVDRAGYIHVVLDLGSDWQSYLYYVRGIRLGSGVQWDEPARVAEQDAWNPRVVATESRLHILSGHNLSHHVSSDGGTSWKKLNDFIIAGPFSSSSYDIAAIGESLLVVNVARRNDRHQILVVTNWRPRDDTTHTVVRELNSQIDFHWDVAIAAREARVDVVSGLSSFIERVVKGPNGYTMYSSYGRYDYITSLDRGRSWKAGMRVSGRDSSLSPEFGWGEPGEDQFDLAGGAHQTWLYTVSNVVERRSLGGGLGDRLHGFAEDTSPAVFGGSGLPTISVLSTPRGAVVSWVRGWHPKIALPHPLAYADRMNNNDIEGFLVPDSLTSVLPRVRRLSPTKSRPRGLRQFASELELFTLWSAARKPEKLPNPNVGAALFLSVEALDSLVTSSHKF